MRSQLDDALVRLGAADTLGAAYEAWTELLLARAAAAADRAREREQIERRAALLIGALKQAGAVKRSPRRGKSKAMAKGDPFSQAESQARAEHDRMRSAIAQREKREEAYFEKTVEGLKATLLKRARALLKRGAVELKVRLQPVGADRALVHAERPAEDASVLACLLLSGKLPTRHAFFADDAVDDVSRGPARYYADEGLTRVRFDSVDEEDSVLDQANAFLPVRTHFPIRLPERPFPRFRLVHHGPMAELEARREGRDYAAVMPREDAELFTAHLLRLKLGGQVRLDLRVE